MKFTYIKDDIIVPKKQIIIDKKVVVDGKVFHVLSVYEDKNDIKIMTLHLGDLEAEDDSDFDFIEHKTMREELTDMAKTKDYTRISISGFYFDDKEIKTKSGSSGGLYENYHSYFTLSYIANLGIDIEYLDDVLLRNIFVSVYSLDVNSLEELNIENVKSLKISRHPYFENKLTETNFNITKNKEQYSFVDEDNVEHIFKARLSEIDIWGELVPKMEEIRREAYENMDEKEKELAKNAPSIEETYEGLCPKGMNLLCVAYESDVQLEFYTREYLDSEMVISNTVGVFFFRDKETGEKISYLHPVEKSKVDSLEVELFLWIKSTEFEDIVINVE